MYEGRKFSVILRDAKTREKRIVDGGVFGETTLFQWTEGNYGCDCNRANEFDNGTLYDADEPCGEGRYILEAFVFSPGGDDENIVRPENVG